MAVRADPFVFFASVVVHAGLGWAVVRVEPRELPPPPPVVIEIREVEPEPKPIEPEPPEPIPAEPELEQPKPEPVEPEPVEPPTEPEPRPAKPAPSEPPTASPPSEAPPEFGLELGGPAGPDGLAVPQGDPNGKPGGAAQPKQKVEKRARKLESPEPAKHESGCSETQTKPKPLALDKPTYTEAARAAAIEGAVRLKLSISRDGEVETVEVLQSLDPELDARAVEAVKAARFEPARRCGEAVAASVTLSIRFSL